MIEKISSIALITFSLVLLYVAFGAFQRFDRIDDMMDKSERILVNVDHTLVKLKESKDFIPTTVRDSSKGFIDGIRDSLNKESE